MISKRDKIENVIGILQSISPNYNTARFQIACLMLNDVASYFEAIVIATCLLNEGKAFTRLPDVARFYNDNGFAVKRTITGSFKIK